MLPCVVIANSCESIPPEQIIKGILGLEDLPEASFLIPEAKCYPWHIDTKYYEADVQLCSLERKSIGTQKFADSVNALVITFDGLSEDGLSTVDQWVSFTKEFEAEIKILVCDHCIPNEPNQIISTGISKLEAQTWCVKNGFELVELNPVAIKDDDSDLEDDFPETTGIKRVIQALHAHMWPNLVLKGEQKQTSLPAIAVERLGPTEMPEESFEELFQNLNLMKSKAESLSPDQRKVFAEKMAVAFWKSIGGSDSEVEGLSTDDDNED